MRICVVALALVTVALCPSRSHAQSRVSIELGGIVSAYDVVSGPAAARSAIRTPDAVAGAVVSGGSSSASQGIAAFEVRPTVTLENGFLMGVGFRVGQAGLGDNGSSLVGGDVAIGYQHRFGHFMPFIKGEFGINSYDVAGSQTGHQNDLRFDGVIGSRLYVSQRMFISASAFAGWGDRYGAALSVGGDVLQVFRRGVMP
jgi:hypothetical protein